MGWPFTWARKAAVGQLLKTAFESFVAGNRSQVRGCETSAVVLVEAVLVVTRSTLTLPALATGVRFPVPTPNEKLGNIGPAGAGVTALSFGGVVFVGGVLGKNGVN